MGFLLFALIPPSNIEKEVVSLQRRLFSSRGLVSPLALPAVIPVLATDDGETIPSQTQLKDCAARGLRFTTGAVLRQKGCLVWSLESSGATAQLRQVLAGRWPKKRDSIPSLDGFFLAGKEKGIDLSDILGELTPPPVLHFPARALTVLRVCPSADCSEWWNGIVWEEVLSVRLRKSG